MAATYSVSDRSDSYRCGIWWQPAQHRSRFSNLDLHTNAHTTVTVARRNVLEHVVIVNGHLVIYNKITNETKDIIMSGPKLGTEVRTACIVLLN
jgi:hypothetical protein